MRVTTAFNKMLAIPGAWVASVEFSPEGYSRMRENFDFVTDLIRAAVRGGATVVNCPDTIGGASEFQGDEYFVVKMARHAEIIARELGLVQFWSVAYGDGYQPEESWEDRDIAQDRVSDAIDAGDPDAKLITAWFTGWRDADDLAPVPLS